MLSQILGNPKFFSLLFIFDGELARMAKERRCQICGSALHAANFSRKPRVRHFKNELLGRDPNIGKSIK